MATLLAEARSPLTHRQLQVKGVKIIARSLVKELRHHGYEERDILALSTELLGLVTSDVKAREKATLTIVQ